MILDADDGNVARAHVKIKPIALSQRQGDKVVMDGKRIQMLRKALTPMSTPNHDYKQRERSTGRIENGCQFVL